MKADAGVRKGSTVKTLTVAIAGNPNCGKTTLFNGLTGGKQRIGNWPGVTVEKKEGTFKQGDKQVRLVDLPGIYALSATSEDEKVARDYILSGEPDLVINILDATNMQRNLFLTTQLLEMGVPMLLVLNMKDLAERKSIAIKTDVLSKQLGVPVEYITATNQKDINGLIDKIVDAADNPSIPGVEVSYPNEVEDCIAAWVEKLDSFSRSIGANPRWTALKLIERDAWITELVTAQKIFTPEELDSAILNIEGILKETTDIILADYIYGFIHGITSSTVGKAKSRISATDRIDKVVMNRVLGIPIFLAVMYLIFWVAITIGGAFIDFFDILFGTVFVDGFGVLLASMGAPEWLQAVLAGGVGAGIQTVATFIPIIFFMFLMLSLLEDSGYMARAAFVMDRFMRMIGLPGKAFVPMLVGFGCTVPAIMGARTIESKKDRFMTVFMCPFMSCGARLPVYALFAAALFPFAAGSIVFSLYIVGIALAIVTGLILKKTLFKGESSYFVMELPPYHAPRMGHIMVHTWNRLKLFMFRAGKVIVLAVLVLAFLNSLGIDGSFGNEDSENSVLARIGSGIIPIFKPMGLKDHNWPAAVGIFTGLFAKEAVVGTLSSLYAQQAAEEEAAEGEEEGFEFGAGIVEALASVPEGLAGIFGGLADPLGAGMISGDEEAVSEEVEADLSVFSRIRNNFTGASAYAYLLFVLLYFPCVAALGAAVRELGSGFGWLLAGYLTVFGWLVSTLFYQVVQGHQALWIIIPLAMMAGIILLFRSLGKRTTLIDKMVYDRK